MRSTPETTGIWQRTVAAARSAFYSALADGTDLAITSSRYEYLEALREDEPEVPAIEQLIYEYTCRYGLAFPHELVRLTGCTLEVLYPHLAAMLEEGVIEQLPSSAYRSTRDG